MNRPRVVVTGLGVVSSIGIGWPVFWKSLLAGRSGIQKIRYIDTADYPTHYGGEVVDFDPLLYMPQSIAKRLGRGSQFAIAATRMALEDARLNLSEKLFMAGTCLGTTLADIQALEEIHERWLRAGDRGIPARLIPQFPSYNMVGNVAKLFGLTGPCMSVPTACSAGNYAIGYAADLLKMGKANVMICGGADPFSRIAFTGFNRLFALAPERCQPFDKNRQGTLLGEGAGILVLELLETAVERNAKIYAEILGCGYSCDGYHMTMPEVNGIERVIRNALRDAEIEPQNVNYISAHGTGTPANDRAECIAIRVIFGSHTDYMPISSIKSMIGHTMGAASALEAIACVLATCYDKIPPTINHETDDFECQIDCVPNAARVHKTRIALNNSFAFGGNNACVVFSKWEGGNGEQKK